MDGGVPYGSWRDGAFAGGRFFETFGDRVDDEGVVAGDLNGVF